MDKTLELQKIANLKNAGYFPFELPNNKVVPQGFVEENGVVKRIISVKDEQDWQKVKQEQSIKETIIEEKI